MTVITGTREANVSSRAKAVLERISRPDRWALAVLVVLPLAAFTLPTLAGHPILLVDDSYRTGWTMTIAASLLRQAGASAVLPFVVHQLP